MNVKRYVNYLHKPSSLKRGSLVAVGSAMLGIWITLYIHVIELARKYNTWIQTKVKTY